MKSAIVLFLTFMVVSGAGWAQQDSYNPFSTEKNLKQIFDEPKTFQDLTVPYDTYNPYETNFERFRNSPCYEKFGYTPPRTKDDAERIEKMYSDCERGEILNKLKKVLGGAVIGLVVIGVVYYSRKHVSSTN